jgi:hypothetical protein
MPLSDLSPLSYFKELHFLPRVIFTIAGVLFFVGLGKKWDPYALGLVLVFLALGYNFLVGLQ